MSEVGDGGGRAAGRLPQQAGGGHAAMLPALRGLRSLLGGLVPPKHGVYELVADTEMVAAPATVHSIPSTALVRNQWQHHDCVRCTCSKSGCSPCLPSRHAQVEPPTLLAVVCPGDDVWSLYIRC